MRTDQLFILQRVSWFDSVCCRLVMHQVRIWAGMPQTLCPPPPIILGGKWRQFVSLLLTSPFITWLGWFHQVSPLRSYPLFPFWIKKYLLVKTRRGRANIPFLITLCRSIFLASIGFYHGNCQMASSFFPSTFISGKKELSLLPYLPSHSCIHSFMSM